MKNNQKYLTLIENRKNIYFLRRGCKSERKNFVIFHLEKKYIFYKNEKKRKNTMQQTVLHIFI